MRKILMIIAPFLLIGCSFFNSSKEIDLIPYSQNDKFGYFDLEGKIVINPQFEFATVFREGLALVKTTGDNGKWGYIDKEGKFLINATYKNATVFQEGLAWVVSENSAPSAIDIKGEIKFTLKDAESVRLFSDDLAAFSKMDSTSTIWGFVDKSGKQEILPQFYDVGNFFDGKCLVKNKEGKWGYIDKSGKIIINYQFDNAYKFVEGKAVVYLDDKAGVIDEDGKYIINPQFQSIYIDNNKFLIVQDDKVGWCDKNGKILINPQFEDAEIFGNSDLACIKSGDKYGYIDEDGKISINPQFEIASQFMGDIALVKTGDKYGLIDKKGKYIVNPQFENIGSDVYAFLNDFSYKSSVDSDYLNTEAILKVININNPENLSFEDDFKTVLRKLNKTINDFSSSNDIHSIFENKYINNESSFDFGVMGNVKIYNFNSYEYQVSNEKPTGFVYLIKLKGRALGKNEIVQKAFEKKLTSYNLMKKGFVDDEYTSVYKSDNNIIITLNDNLNGILIYVLNSNYEISYYLNKIVEMSGKSTNNYNEPEVNEQEVTEEVAPVVEEAAPIIDSVTY